MFKIVAGNTIIFLLNGENQKKKLSFSAVRDIVSKIPNSIY